MPACWPCRSPFPSGSAPRKATSTSCAARSSRPAPSACSPPTSSRILRVAAAAGTTARLAGAMSAFEALPRIARRAAAVRRGRALLHPVLVRQHAPADGRRYPPGPAHGQHRRLAGEPGDRRRRFRRELAAALSRHGPDRLRAGADVRPAQRRPVGAARFRTPAPAVAVADLATPRHHHLQPELRLRAGRPPRPGADAGRPRPVVPETGRHRRRHDPAGGAPPLRRRLRLPGLRRPRLHAELRHGRGLRRLELRPAICRLEDRPPRSLASSCCAAT